MTPLKPIPRCQCHPWNVTPESNIHRYSGINYTVQTVSETNWRWGWLMKKTEGRQSRDTAPLIRLTPFIWFKSVLRIRKIFVRIRIRLFISSNPDHSLYKICTNFLQEEIVWTKSGLFMWGKLTYMNFYTCIMLFRKQKFLKYVNFSSLGSGSVSATLI
jgi:hypothetical protein